MVNKAEGTGIEPVDPIMYQQFISYGDQIVTDFNSNPLIIIEQITDNICVLGARKHNRHFSVCRRNVDAWE